MEVKREDLTCKELIELVTEYLEGALPEEDRRWFDDHIAGCGNCTVYLEQFRQTIAAAGRAQDEPVAPETRDALLGVFRGWRESHA